jgi:hypothetical protein
MDSFLIFILNVGSYWICEGGLNQLKLKRIRGNRLDDTANAKFNIIVRQNSTL